MVHNGCLRRICQIFWPNKISNNENGKPEHHQGDYAQTPEMAGTCVEDGAGLHHKSHLKMDTTWQKKTWKAQNHLAQKYDTRVGTDELVMGRGPTCCQGPNAMESAH